MTNGFDLGHDLDIWILKVICDLDHLVTKVRCKDLPDSDWVDFRCRPAVDSSSIIIVHTITRDPFNLGSPNLKHRCKRPWLISLLFWGVIDFYLQGQIYHQSQNLPHFELVHAITHHPFKLGPPNLDQRCKVPWLRSRLFWGSIELDMWN